MANSYALFEWFSGISSATTSNIFMQLGHMSEKMKMKLLQKTTSSYLLPFMRSLGPEIAKIDKTLWMSQNQRNVILFFHDYKSSQVRNSHYLLLLWYFMKLDIFHFTLKYYISYKKGLILGVSGDVKSWNSQIFQGHTPTPLGGLQRPPPQTPQL